MMTASDVLNGQSSIPSRSVKQASDSSNILLKSTLGNIPNWLADHIREKQLCDPDLKVIIQFLEQSLELPPWKAVSDKSYTVKTLWRMMDRLRISQGLLCRK
ncbi:hypothetical protein DPMN_053838 [Dreissena polymorpha]|uniref:Uncharacterized protein n=1 Tax=Dreissena polymorpha TaxID=45954 RepID=A0A9D4CMV3_DREPO|nr:hypothetical protein DPMN_053838 [Dreissena polymorpha]